jgi:hypothetical protein
MYTVIEICVCLQEKRKPNEKKHYAIPIIASLLFSSLLFSSLLFFSEFEID